MMELSEFETASMKSTLRTLLLRPSDILNGEGRIPDNQNDPLLMLARPTWIAKHYKVGGVLLLGKNPAGGSASHKEASHPSDAAFAEALTRLVDERDIESYRFWRDVAQPRAMEKWRIWNNSAKAVIRALEPIGINQDNIAFGNLVPFRTNGNSVKHNEYLRGWRYDVGHVVDVLKPGLIVKMTAEFPDISRYTRITVLGFRRSNGDRGISPSGVVDLQVIRKWAECRRGA